MFKRLFAGLLALTLLGGAETARAAGGDYFPLAVGTQWVYGGSPREIAQVVRIADVLRSIHGPVYVWEGFQGKRLIRMADDGKVMDLQGDTWRVLFDLNAAEGTSWTVEAVEGSDDILNHATVTVASRVETVTVPYGAFRQTVHLKIKLMLGARIGVTDAWFAPEVGLVKWTELSSDGTQSYELMRFGVSEDPMVVSPDGNSGGSTGSGPDRPIPIPLPVVYPDDLFPTQVSLAWVYEGLPLKNYREVNLVGVERSVYPRTFIWDGLQGKRRIRKDDDGKIYEIFDGSERLLLDLNAEEGASWTIEGNTDDILNGSVFIVISRSETVDVPFGSFENVLHLGVKPNPHLADAGLGEVWFAPGVGLVKWTEITIAGPQTYSLVKHSGIEPPIVIDPYVPEPEPKRPLEDYENRTGGVTKGVRYELGTVQSSYVQGDVIDMQYRVTAVDGDVTLSFSSTQQYDFRLDNAQGETVWAWSATRLFGKMLTELTLKQGESHSFVDYLNLDYEVLPSGEYTLIGWMPTNTASEETYVKVSVSITGELTRGSLVGTVTDENGNPVYDAYVSMERFDQAVDLVDADGGVGAVEPAFASPMSRSGTFQFYGLKAGTYGVTVRASGYHLHAQNVAVVAGENRLDIQLKTLAKDGYANVHEMRNKRFIVELATDRQLYAIGDSVQVRYRLTNISGETLALTFPSGQDYDLTLDGSNGRTWTWSETRAFIQVISSRTLPAGESIEFYEAFALNEEWAKNSPSFLMTGFLAVAAQTDGEVSREETEAYVKFAIDGWVLPEPGRPGPLVVSLRTDRELYQQGDTVQVSYRLTNVSEEPVTLKFNAGQRYDLVLYGSEGPVWGWSWARLFAAEKGEIVLAPRDTFAFEETLYLDVLPEAKDGVYVLRAYMSATGENGTPDQDATESKVRFYVGEQPTVEPTFPPIDPAMNGRLTTDLNVDFRADSVYVTYRVVNVSPESLHLMFRSGQVYDLVFEGAEGELWRWSQGRGFTDALNDQKLVSGDSVVVQTAFVRPKTEDGTYELRGYLTVSADDAGAVSAAETQASVKVSMRAGEVLRLEAQPGGAVTDAKGHYRTGDMDGDGVINFGDFLRFAAAFGKRSGMAAFDTSADMDQNGEVDFGDFLTFAAHYGR